MTRPPGGRRNQGDGRRGGKSPARLIFPSLSTQARTMEANSERFLAWKRPEGRQTWQKWRGSRRLGGRGGGKFGLGGGGLNLWRGGAGVGLVGGEVLPVGPHQLGVALEHQQVLGVVRLGVVGEVE